METDTSGTATQGIGNGSMSGGNDISATPTYGAPGGESQQIQGKDIRPLPDPVPPVSQEHIPGVGMRGGEDHASGTNPGAGHSWDTVNGRSDPYFTGTTAPVKSESGD